MIFMKKFYVMLITFLIFTTVNVQIASASDVPSLHRLAPNLILDDAYGTGNYYYYHYACRDGYGLSYASKYVELLTRDYFRAVESGSAPTGRAKYWSLIHTGRSDVPKYRFESEPAHVYVDAYEYEIEVLVVRGLSYS